MQDVDIQQAFEDYAVYLDATKARVIEVQNYVNSLLRLPEMQTSINYFPSPNKHLDDYITLFKSECYDQINTTNPSVDLIKCVDSNNTFIDLKDPKNSNLTESAWTAIKNQAYILYNDITNTIPTAIRRVEYDRVQFTDSLATSSFMSALNAIQTSVLNVKLAIEQSLNEKKICCCDN